MFKLSFLLVIGIGAAMLVGGRELTPDEMAELGIEPSIEVARATAEPLLVAAPAVAEEPQARDELVTPVPDVVDVVAGTDTLATPAPEPVEVVAVAPVPEPEPAAEPPSVADEIAAALSDAQVWYVNAQQVNVREGPSTDFAKVGKVAFGDAIEILSDPEAEWVKIRVEGDGVEGYIARRFLQDSEPNG